MEKIDLLNIYVTEDELKAYSTNLTKLYERSTRRENFFGRCKKIIFNIKRELLKKQIFTESFFSANDRLLYLEKILTAPENYNKWAGIRYEQTNPSFVESEIHKEVGIGVTRIYVNYTFEWYTLKIKLQKFEDDICIVAYASEYSPNLILEDDEYLTDVALLQYYINRSDENYNENMLTIELY